MNSKLTVKENERQNLTLPLFLKDKPSFGVNSLLSTPADLRIKEEGHQEGIGIDGYARSLWRSQIVPKKITEET